MAKTIAAIGALIACAGARAATLELNPNAHFDADVAGLVLSGAPAGAALEWSPLDLTGRVPSGSARLSGPAGTYFVSICGQVPPLPFARYDFAARVRLRSPDGAATVFGELVPMFGGDDPVDGGPCRRPRVDYASAYGFPAPEADFGLLIRNSMLWPDVAFGLVIHKPDGDFLLDGLSLTIDGDPIATDGFE